MIEETLKNLKANRINARYFISRDELEKYLSDVIRDDMLVGVGDSMTLEELDLYEYLRNRNIRFLDKYDPKLSKDEKKKLYIDNFSSDCFITSANAITNTGKIYNLDGNGSRVAPMIYGPKRVIIICGINKIVETDELALLRIREIAAPKDAIRLNKNTPCTKTGKCMDCKSKEKICNYHTVIQGQFDENRIEVLFIDGSYGY